MYKYYGSPRNHNVIMGAYYIDTGLLLSLYAIFAPGSAAKGPKMHVYPSIIVP